MHRRTVALVLAGLALVLAVLGIFIPVLAVPAGLAVFAALVAGLVALPWRRIVRVDIPAMEGLFARPGAGKRWCGACGRPATPGTCPHCGQSPPRKADKTPRRAKT